MVVSQTLPIVEKETVQEISKITMRDGASAFENWLKELEEENETVYTFIALSSITDIQAEDVRRHMENMVGLYKLLKLQLEKNGNSK